LPASLKDLYGWIHTVILSALPAGRQVRLATCQDCPPADAKAMAGKPAEAARQGDVAKAVKPPTSLATRMCFSEPVTLDVLAGDHKIVGGALCRRNNVFLYQGSIQGCDDLLLESRLTDAFLRALLPA
jgi:hypothetical protein